MAKYRANTHTLYIDAPELGFGEVNATFDANALILPCWDLAIKLAHQPIENQTIRTNLGKWKPGVGLTHPESEVSFTTYPAGAGPFGVATLATANALTRALAAVCGQAPVASTGDKVKAASVPTTILVREATPGRHAGYSLVAFRNGATGKVHHRPVGDYTVDVMDLLMALPFTPNATAPNEDLIYGGLTIKPLEGIASYQMQVLARGNNAADNWEAYGMNGNLSMPAVAPHEPQTIAFTFKAADFINDISGALNQDVPTMLGRVGPSAGGEFRIGEYGSTDNECLEMLNISWETATEWVHERDACDPRGIQGWFTQNRETKVNITVPVDQLSPTGNTWYDDFAATDAFYHLLGSWGGTTAGQLFSVYFPKLHLAMEPEHAELDGIQVLNLTLLPEISYGGDDLFWLGQS